MKWYGSVNNRLEENNNECNTIEVGMGMTKFGYTDRHPYEVVEVADQKHVNVRSIDVAPIGKPMENKWELTSNDKNPIINLVKRGQYWYRANTLTAEQLDAMDLSDPWQALSVSNFDLTKVRNSGKQTKYTRWNVSFGNAEYYYDYSF